jgi:hypothetical protein
MTSIAGVPRRVYVYEMLRGRAAEIAPHTCPKHYLVNVEIGTHPYIKKIHA